MIPPTIIFMIGAIIAGGTRARNWNKSPAIAFIRFDKDLCDE